jgi:hypothetical protein
LAARLTPAAAGEVLVAVMAIYYFCFNAIPKRTCPGSIPMRKM